MQGHDHLPMQSEYSFKYTSVLEVQNNNSDVITLQTASIVATDSPNNTQPAQ